MANRLTALGRMLAVLAALALVLGVHPLHAHAAGAAAEQSHFSTSCVKAGVEEPAHAKTGTAPSGHADCAPLFHPLLRTAAVCTVPFSMVAGPAPPARPFRQLISPFDPPPPRARA